MRTKVTQLSTSMSPDLKEQIWQEAARLHLTPSVWARQAITWGLERSQAIPPPDEYVITLTEVQARELRKKGFRLEFHPIPEEA